ncbi:restriction endonuclease [bacterium]|nr:MAG: restriction endonuclease [bacterium]
MNIKIGEIFRYRSGASKLPPGPYPDFYALTKGKYKKGFGTGGKGIFNYARIQEKNKNFDRIPAFLIHSNPYKEGTEITPWVDIINSDEGYAIYNGDNKSSKLNAVSSPGNKALVETLPLYSDPAKRIFAPPLILFKQELLGGKRKGYRSFQGYGVPTNTFVRIQRENKSTGYFTNLVFEIALLNLDSENEIFPWEWIDSRRNPNFVSEDTLNFAPRAWREWVRRGNDAIETLRRRITKKRITREKSQKELTKEEIDILRRIYDFYKSKASKYHFEGLASAVACRIIGGNITRGWVTPRSGDKGIDFVCRLDLSEGFGKASIVVLGQAKCISLNSSISGHDLARVAARIQRGWIGVYVTTGCFSDNAQEELIEDKYPIILINGKKLAQEVKLMLNIDNISLEELLKKHSEWYEINVQPLPPSRIIEWEFPQSFHT